VLCSASLFVLCSASLFVLCSASLFVLCSASLFVLCNASLFVLCSASVSALQIVFNNILYGSTAKWETSGHIVGACLPGASVTKTATLLGVSRAAISKVMLTYRNHGRTSSAKRNSG